VLTVDDTATASTWLQEPRADVIEQNYERARARFSLADLPARIEAALLGVGWADW